MALLDLELCRRDEPSSFVSVGALGGRGSPVCRSGIGGRFRVSTGASLLFVEVWWVVELEVLAGPFVGFSTVDVDRMQDAVVDEIPETVVQL